MLAQCFSTCPDENGFHTTTCQVPTNVTQHRCGAITPASEQASHAGNTTAVNTLSMHHQVSSTECQQKAPCPNQDKVSWQATTQYLPKRSTSYSSRLFDTMQRLCQCLASLRQISRGSILPGMQTDQARAQRPRPTVRPSFLLRPEMNCDSRSPSTWS